MPKEGSAYPVESPSVFDPSSRVSQDRRVFVVDLKVHSMQDAFTKTWRIYHPVQPNSNLLVALSLSLSLSLRLRRGSVCLCVCVCVCACVSVCVFVCLCVSLCGCSPIQVSTCTQPYAYIYIYAGEHVRPLACACVFVCLAQLGLARGAPHIKAT